MTRIGEPVCVCDSCQFEVWYPFATLGESVLGLVDDARYPGRVLLALDSGGSHFESLDELPSDALHSFVADLVRVVAAVKSGTGAAHVNVEFLGNQEHHLHAHIIPRRPDEQFSTVPIWLDSRDQSSLSKPTVRGLVEAIAGALAISGQEPATHPDGGV